MRILLRTCGRHLPGATRRGIYLVYYALIKEVVSSLISLKFKAKSLNFKRYSTLGKVVCHVICSSEFAILQFSIPSCTAYVVTYYSIRMKWNWNSKLYVKICVLALFSIFQKDPGLPTFIVVIFYHLLTLILPHC